MPSKMPSKKSKKSGKVRKSGNHSLPTAAVEEPGEQLVNEVAADGTGEQQLYEPLTPELAAVVEDELPVEQQVVEMEEGEGEMKNLVAEKGEEMEVDQEKVGEVALEPSLKHVEVEQEFANLGFDCRVNVLEKEVRVKTGGSTQPEGVSQANASSGQPYVVCQSVERGVITAPVGDLRNGWPFFILVEDELVETGNLLKCGDIVHVKGCVWRDGYEKLSGDKNTSQDMKPWISPVGILNWQASAQAIGEIIQLQYFQQAGIITEKNMDTEKGRLRSLSVSSPALICSQRLYARQFVADFNHEDVEVGKIVLLFIAQITRPAELRLGPAGTYVLPKSCPFGSFEDEDTHCPFMAVGVGRPELDFTFPFRQNLSYEGIQWAEQVMAAAVSVCLHRIESDLNAFRVITAPTIIAEIPGGEGVPPKKLACLEHWVDSKKRLVRFGEVWEEDGPIRIKVIKDRSKPCGIGHIMETNRGMVNRAFLFQAKFQIVHQEIKNYDTMDDFDAISEGVQVEIRPQCSVAVLSQRMGRLYESNFSAWAQKQGAGGELMRILLAITDRLPEPAVDWQQIHDQHPALRRLEGGQQQSALYMLDGTPRCLFQQAPPGTGKTFTAASIAAAMLSHRPSTVILCVAPLNVAVVKLCEEMEAAMEAEGINEEVLALFSGNGKLRYRDQVMKIARHTLAEAVSVPELLQQLTAKEKDMVCTYQENCVSNPRATNEGKIAQILLQKRKRRVFFTTLSLAEQIGHLFGDVSMVILDEAGQAPFCQTMSVLSKMPKLEKLMVTGDRFQLRVHMKSLPTAVHSGFGLDTIIINLDAAPGVDKTTLTVNFRSHAQLVACIEAGAYAPNGEALLAGPAEFSMLTGMPNFKLPVQNSPLILVHLQSQMRSDNTSFSSNNPEQTNVVMDLLSSLSHFPGDIRVICLYSGQAADIGEQVGKNGMDRVQVMTADSTQGHESDLVVVVTTKSGRGGAATTTEREEFWADSSRVNVALSRSKQGLVVVGDLAFLYRSGGIWTRFLDKAMEFTVVVDPIFPQIAADARSRYVDGVLADAEGVTTKCLEFYRILGMNGADSNAIPPQAGPSGNPSGQRMPSVRFARPPPFVQGQRRWNAQRGALDSAPGCSRANAGASSSPHIRQWVPAGVCRVCRMRGHFARDCPERNLQ